jgi:murein DD-endopeptidase MepM/ murein hydrolase activator NlpD
MIANMTPKIYAQKRDVFRSLRLDSLMAFLGVRDRYILTRKNHLRLRVLVPFLICLMGGAIWFGQKMSTQISHASLYASMEPAAGTMGSTASFFGQDPQQQMGLSQKRLQRYAALTQDGDDYVDDNEIAIIAAPSGPVFKDLEIDKGDTLAGVMQTAGVSGRESYLVVEALKDIFDPRDIRPGQKLAIRLDPSADLDGAYQFGELRLVKDSIESVIVTHNFDINDFEATLDKKKTETKTHAGVAEIELSLYGSALKAGIPSAVVANAMKIYAWDVDFLRDIGKGDRLEVLYESVETEDGAFVKAGNVLFAKMTVGGREIEAYRYEKNDGSVEYFGRDGESMRKALMRTPVDGARLSSGFGMRHHPVLGYNKMHKGLDFAAPTGTPIYAAGDGVIERANRFGAYGNYIRIRHNGELKTAYAHLHRFGKNIRAGKQVTQGTIIGYVGTTGRSTGPHLHYEVIMNGQQVNPKKVAMTQSDPLRGSHLEAFKKQVKSIDRQFKSLASSKTLASVQSTN